MDESEPTTRVSRERVEALANAGALFGRRRRLYVLLALRELSSPSALDELVRAVCRHEFGDDVSEDRRDRVRLTLVHNHLPKLDAAGIVDWHPEEDRVELLGDPTVESVVDAVFDV